MDIPRVSVADGFCSFVQHFLLPNKPCIFEEQHTTNWKSRKLWQCNGKPNFVYLKEEFGSAQVPVADCNAVQFQSHPKDTWKLGDYLTYWEETLHNRQYHPLSASNHRRQTLLYLKDWHFSRDYPDYSAYTVLDAFKSDWLNEVWDQRDSGEQDDYRFVYMGPKGTWTPFHADVFRSYSWSTNVCGQKEWLLYPLGEEEHLRDKLGNLPFDVTGPEMGDSDKYPNFHKAKGPIRVIQNIGETIFVPSGWHHQVRNLEDTISINHNWTNGFGIDYMWRHLKSELQLVEKEIFDCQGMKGWADQCQLILKCSAGMNFTEFFDFLLSIASPRLKQLEKIVTCDSTADLEGISELPDSLILLVTQQSMPMNTSNHPPPFVKTGESVNVCSANMCHERDVDGAVTLCVNSKFYSTDSALLEALFANLPCDMRRLLKFFGKWSRWSDCIKILVTIRVYEIVTSCHIMDCICTEDNDSTNITRCALHELLK